MDIFSLAAFMFDPSVVMPTRPYESKYNPQDDESLQNYQHEYLIVVGQFPVAVDDRQRQSVESYTLVEDYGEVGECTFVIGFENDEEGEIEKIGGEDCEDERGEVELQHRNC